MKHTIIKSFIAFFLVAVSLNSCKKDEVKTYVSPASSFNLTSNYTAPLVLLQANQTDTVIKFTRDSTNFGFKAQLKFTLEIAKKSTNFTSIGVPQPDFTSVKNLALTVKDLNRLLITISKPEVATDYQIRVAASVEGVNKVIPIYSNVIEINATPYKDIITYVAPQALWVAGNFQSWDPSSAPQIVDPNAQTKNSKHYEGYINFTDPNPTFKIVQCNSWCGDYGDGSGSGTSGVMQSGPNNIKLTNGAGVYLLRANTVDLIWSAVKIDFWGIIGSATPTNTTPTQMNYDPVTNSYSITTDLTIGKLKFSANTNGDFIFGDDNVDGTPDYGGADIDISIAGNYTVTLNLLAGNYSYDIKKN